MKFKSNILKLCLFATGLSGIVAEYILATLATYFLGDSVFQWAMIVSVMLFSMGLGSRLSQYFKTSLLKKFIFIEFALSILVAFSSLCTYTIAAFTDYTVLIIYGMGIIIGILIGIEIPMVVRLNKEFESLRVNIASVIEKDYYGCLAGGLFFSFVGLPILGLTYTPFVLGFINFLVALALLYLVKNNVVKKLRNKLYFAAGIVVVVLLAGVLNAKPVIDWGEQSRYKDKIIFSKQSKYQRIVLTNWNDHYWLYLNGNQQLSTLDEAMYHEPLVHPVMKLTEGKNILLLGGGDGCAAREILKYKNVESITVVDLDPAMTDLAKNHEVLKSLNNDSFNNKKVTIHNKDAYVFLENHLGFYDAIIIDLPDPRTVELGRLYSYEFYKMCYKHLRPNGLIITQAGSPYYATSAFKCINKTLGKAGFNTVPLHNQIVTMGEWGWMMGSKTDSSEVLKKKLKSLTFEDIPTKWINNEAMDLITSFGKLSMFSKDSIIEANQIHNPVLYKYYLKGNWEVY